MAKPADAAKGQAWERRLRRFESGNWSVAEFCRREGVTEAVFYYWLRRLASSEGAVVEQRWLHHLVQAA